MFIISRLAHYLKVLQREQIGSWKERADLERELNKWIRQYVADRTTRRRPCAAVARCAQAQIIVSDVEGKPAGTRST